MRASTDWPQPSAIRLLALTLLLAGATLSLPVAAQQGLLTGGSDDEAGEQPSELSQIEERIAALRTRNAQWRELAAEHQRTSQEVAARSIALDREIALLKDRKAVTIPERASSSELDVRVLEAEQDLSLARQEILALDAELAQRAERRKRIPELLAIAKQKLVQLDAAPARPVAEDPEAAAAASTLKGLEREVLESEILAYQNELSSYDARGRLLNRERDRAAMRIAYYETLVFDLREAAKERERLEVARDTEAAENLLEGLESPPPEFESRFRQIVGANKELADQWTGEAGLVDQIDDVSVKLARADKKAASLEAELNQLAARVDAVGLVDSVGVLLRRHRAEAPDPGMYRRFIRMRQERIGAVQLELIKLRERRQALTDIDVLVDEAMATVKEPISAEQRVELEDLLQQLFEAQRKYLNALMADYEMYFQKLVDFDARQEELIDRTEKLLDYVDEHILWVPSGRAIEPNLLSDGADGMGWLLGPKYLAQLGRGVSDTAGRGLLWHLLVLVFVILFFPASRRIRERIRYCGVQAKRPDIDRFGPTMEAFYLTLALAAWLPLVLAYVGWRLGLSPVATQYTRDIAASLVAVAVVWFTLAFPRQFSRPGGVAEAHFNWPEATAKRLFVDLAWLGAIYLPATFLIQVFEIRGEDLWRESIGRLCFLVAMLTVAVFNYRQFRRKGCASLLFRRTTTRGLTIYRLAQVAAIALPLAPSGSRPQLLRTGRRPMGRRHGAAPPAALVEPERLDWQPAVSGVLGDAAGWYRRGRCQGGPMQSFRMRRRPRRGGAAVGFLAAASALILAACGGPFLAFPGGALKGEVVEEPVTDWSFVDARFLDLETRPDDPYSVELNYVVRDGELFIDPAEGRQWLEYIRADPRVRARFGDKIYPLQAVLVGRPGELDGFPADRFIYRLESRAPGP